MEFWTNWRSNEKDIIMESNEKESIEKKSIKNI